MKVCTGGGGMVRPNDVGDCILSAPNERGHAYACWPMCIHVDPCASTWTHVVSCVHKLTHAQACAEGPDGSKRLQMQLKRVQP
eukprot:363701-Chlamydomonas_euryale.AAC.3